VPKLRRFRAVQFKLPDGQPMLLQMGIDSGQLISGVLGSLALRYRCVPPLPPKIQCVIAGCRIRMQLIKS